jgi:hypothetical protein
MSPPVFHLLLCFFVSSSHKIFNLLSLEGGYKEILIKHFPKAEKYGTD